MQVFEEGFFRDSKNGGLLMSSLSPNSIAPLIGSRIVNLTTTARRMPVTPRKIKICRQFTFAECSYGGCSNKYAAIIPKDSHRIDTQSTCPFFMAYISEMIE